MDLTGKFLIAMPGMGDPRFDKSVVFVCSHSSEGTMGLIVNKPGVDLTFADLLAQTGIPQAAGQGAAPPKVQFGGPVEMVRGFVLHSPDWQAPGGSMPVSDDIAMTASLDILKALAQGEGPDKSLVLLGYAGWGPGQLAAEILRNDWLTCDGQAALVFDTPNAVKWAQALASLGVDALALSATAGRA